MFIYSHNSVCAIHCRPNFEQCDATSTQSASSVSKVIGFHNRQLYGNLHEPVGRACGMHQILLWAPTTYYDAIEIECACIITHILALLQLMVKMTSCRRMLLGVGAFIGSVA